MGSTPQSRTVLLVDGDEGLCSALGCGLARRGFSVEVAHSGGAALRAARDRRPEYAVVDLRLPDRSGLKVLAELRAIQPQIRAVMLTGHGSISTAVEAIKLGAIDYLTKPAEADDVIAAFHRDDPDDDAPISTKPMSPSRVAWEHINRVLLQYEGNISATARALSLHRRTLQRKLAKHATRV